MCCNACAVLCCACCRMVAAEELEAVVLPVSKLHKQSNVQGYKSQQLACQDVLQQLLLSPPKCHNHSM